MTTLNEFKKVLPHVPERDQHFAHSLARQWASNGDLSAKQMYWVDKLTQRAVDRVTAVVTVAPVETKGRKPRKVAPAPVYSTMLHYD